MEQLAGQLATWGLDLASIGLLVVLIVSTTELAKKYLAAKGPWLLVAAFISAVAWCSMFYAPDWIMVLRASFIGTVAACGGFQGAKTLAGKIGEDNLKPMGTANRGPSKPGA